MTDQELKAYSIGRIMGTMEACTSSDYPLFVVKKVFTAEELTELLTGNKFKWNLRVVTIEGNPKVSDFFLIVFSKEIVSDALVEKYVNPFTVGTKIANKDLPPPEENNHKSANLSVIDSLIEINKILESYTVCIKSVAIIAEIVDTKKAYEIKKMTKKHEVSMSYISSKISQFIDLDIITTYTPKYPHDRRNRHYKLTNRGKHLFQSLQDIIKKAHDT